MQVFCQIICISQWVACLFIFSVVSFKYAYEFLILMVRLSIYSFELILYMICACVFSHSVMSNSLQPCGNCSPPGSSIHGILQVGILEWVAITFSRGSSQLRDQTRVSCICRQILYYWATREASWVSNLFSNDAQKKRISAFVCPGSWDKGGRKNNKAKVVKCSHLGKWNIHGIWGTILATFLLAWMYLFN